MSKEMNKKTFPKTINGITVRYMADLGEGRHRIGLLGGHKIFVVDKTLNIPSSGWIWIVYKTYNRGRQADIKRSVPVEKKPSE